ncbi:conjugal transfer protein TrbC [Paraburkholderia tropica]|uniref:conjugal transfer protein TrbC n=2 Tax=Burkholderiaceae TaxID=119060 RepID=UPI000B264ACF|nr:conjugal transfer protein TrbC [Paraburkholderia tropica]
MMKQLLSHLNRVASVARAAGARLFGRRELRTTLIAAGLSAVAPIAGATDLSDLSSATDVICLISGWISGPYLFGIGLVLLIFGFIAIAASEGTIAKILSGCVLGIGLAACAIPIMKNHFKISYVCT